MELLITVNLKQIKNEHFLKFLYPSIPVLVLFCLRLTITSGSSSTYRVLCKREGLRLCPSRRLREVLVFCFVFRKIDNRNVVSNVLTRSIL